MTNKINQPLTIKKTASSSLAKALITEVDNSEKVDSLTSAKKNVEEIKMQIEELLSAGQIDDSLNVLGKFVPGTTSYIDTFGDEFDAYKDLYFRIYSQIQNKGGLDNALKILEKSDKLEKFLSKSVVYEAIKAGWIKRAFLIGQKYGLSMDRMINASLENNRADKLIVLAGKMKFTKQQAKLILDTYLNGKPLHGVMYMIEKYDLDFDRNDIINMLFLPAEEKQNA